MSDDLLDEDLLHKLTMSDSLREKLKAFKDLGLASYQMIAKDNDDKPIIGCFFVCAENCQAVQDLIDELEAE